MTDAECQAALTHGLTVEWIGTVRILPPGIQGTIVRPAVSRTPRMWVVDFPPAPGSSKHYLCDPRDLGLVPGQPGTLGHGPLPGPPAATGPLPPSASSVTITGSPATVAIAKIPLQPVMSAKDFAKKYAGSWCTTMETSSMPAGVRAKVIGYVQVVDQVVIVTSGPVFLPGVGLALRSDTRIPEGMIRVHETMMTHYMMQSVEFLVIDDAVEAPIDLKSFPHACPRCGGPAYVGALTIECSVTTCPCYKAAP